MAKIASGAWLKTTVAVASALAAGIANFGAALLVFYRLTGRDTELSLED